MLIPAPASLAKSRACCGNSMTDLFVSCFKYAACFFGHHFMFSPLFRSKSATARDYKPLRTAKPPVCIIQKLRQLAWLLLQTLEVGLGSICGIGRWSGTHKTLVQLLAVDHQAVLQGNTPQLTPLSLRTLVLLGPGFSATVVTFNASVFQDYGLPSSQCLCHTRCSPAQETSGSAVQQAQQ